MLTETTNTGFQPGDRVIIEGTDQTGIIQSYQSGKWKVKLDSGVEVLKEATVIQKRQALMG